MYSVFDLQKDNRRKEVRGTQQQFSRYSVASSSSVNSAAIQSNNIPLQKDNKVQIGIPYDDTKGETGASTQELLFSTYGSQYTFYTLQGDTVFAFDNLPTGRSIEFTLDITVDEDNTSPILITFPQVDNPPVLAGDPGDRLILRFIGVNRTDPTGVDPPVQTFTFLTGVEDTGLGYSIIQKDGIPVTERNTMNFIGTGVTVVDNPTELRTDITIAAAGGGGEFFGPWTADHDAGGFVLNNSGGIDLFANSVANAVSSASFINFESDDNTFRGTLTRNDETPYTAFDTGLILDVPTNNSFSIAVNSVEKFRLDGADNKLVLSIDLDMFDTPNAVARSILNASIISFISNGDVARGQFGRSDFFAGTATGLVTNIPVSANYSITINNNTVFKINSTGNEITFNQLVSPFGESLKISSTQITASLQLDMNSNSITNALFVESNSNDRPGEGFLRMATDDQVIWRDKLNEDNLFIKAARPDLGEGPTTQDAFEFNVAGGVQMYIGEFDISVQLNDIIETADILPGTGTHEVGDSTSFYNQMHSQFFIPENATVVTNRYGLAHTTLESDSSTTDQTYINLDGTNNLSNFAIKREGFTKAIFRRIVVGPPATYELLLGSFPTFESGETSKIQFGANSASSAEISFTEGGNDLILNRQTSTVTTLGVKLQSGGIDRLYARAEDVLLSVPLNMAANDMTNVVNIKSNGDGSATTGNIGELITADGGFDYFVRDKIFWDTDDDTFIQFQTNGIFIESDDAVGIKATGIDDDVTISSTGTTGDVRLKAVNGFVRIESTATIFYQVQNNSHIFEGADIFLTNGTEVIEFADEVAGTSAPTPGISGDINLFNDATTGELSVKKFNGDVISLEGGGGGQNQTPWLSTINADNNILENIRNLEFQEGAQPNGTTVSFISRQTTNLIYNSPGTDGHIFRVNTVQKFGVGPNENNSFNPLDMNSNKIINLTNPTAAQDAATKSYVDSQGSDFSGIQDARQSTEQEGNAFDFEIWMSNSKQGDKDVQQSTALFFTPFLQQTVIFLPIYLGERYRIEAVGIDVGTLNVNDVSMAIYDSEPSLNYPKTRITNSTNSFINTTGIFRTLFNEDVEAGLYWIAIWFDNGAISTIRHWPGVSANSVGWVPVGGTTGTMEPLLGFSFFQTSNILPGLADNDMAFLSGAVVPAVFAKLVFNPN